MSLFKCKCCGADLRVKEGDKVVACEYCGSAQTIPNSQDANVLSVYARGNLLRSQGEFEKAYATFAKLLDGETEDAEAHWNLLLCKYGITYVDDYDGRKKPTINRMSMSSILDDEEYKKTISLADEVVKEQYQEEATSIAKIQDDILQIVQKERPYDVFISYKETDEFNSRTEDSVLAQEIYDKLAEEGYRVFLSRTSLSSVVGHEYEPYIYSALYTAKAMILVACNPDYVNAVWVKNEWQRYLFMMQKEKGKILIPCYRDVDPYDLPKELRRLQGIDASKLGWMQDLSLGLKKVIKKEKEIAHEKTVIAPSGLGDMADQMVQRGFNFLKKGNPEQAKKLFEESLSYADKAMAYMGLLCAGHSKQDFAGLASLHKDIIDDPHYVAALNIASDEEKKSIEGIRESILKNIAADKAQIEEEKRKRYDYAISLKNKGDYFEASKRFSELFGFLDAQTQYDECQQLKAEEDKRKAEEKAAREKEERLAKYYSEVVRISGDEKATPVKLESAISMARVLKSENFGENANRYLTILSKRLSAKKRNKKIAIISCLVAACLAIFVPTMTVCVFIPLGRQNEIIAAIEAKDYDKAYKLLEENGSFGESEKLKVMLGVGLDLERSAYRYALIELAGIGGTYNISLDYNGGTGDAEVSLDNYKIVNEPIKNGYSLRGWMVDDYSLDARNYSASMAFYATYKANVYKITYNLGGGTNDPSNPSTYTVEDDTLNLKNPTRDGYTFVGWNDGSKIVTTIDKGSYGDLVLTAQWSAINYSISYDLGGGTLENEPTAYTIEDSITLPTPSKKGYTFLGWTGSNGNELQKSVSISEGSIGDKSYVANWDLVTYKITYILGGGSNDSANPSFYTIETSDITLLPATRNGYTFAGWSDGSSSISTIKKGSCGDLTLTAEWVAELQTLSVSSSDSSMGNVSVTGHGYTDEAITVTATSTDGYALKGWYYGETLMSMATSYTFSMPAKSYSLTAKFWTEVEEETRRKALGIDPVIDSDNKTVTYGLYPQKRVSDSSTISALNALSSADSNGWYLLDCEYYAKKEANPSDSNYVFDDGEKIASGTTYWYKCEPIVWTIRSSSNNEYSLVSTVLLDSHKYSDIFSGTDSDGYWASNYERSDVRKWLNGDFYNSAFSLGDSNILQTVVDNSASTTDSSSNKYVCANTTDKVYLLSYQDYYSNKSIGRSCKTTDWARANGADHSTTSYNGYYWTRSPSSTFSGVVLYVDCGGNLNSHYNSIYFSVRPGLRIKVAQ